MNIENSSEKSQYKLVLYLPDKIGEGWSEELMNERASENDRTKSI